MVGVVPPPLHEYDNVPVPPVALAVAVPSLPPKQLTAVAEAVTEGPAELITVSALDALHPSEFVMVTVYIPAATFVIEPVVSPLLQ